MNLKHENIFMRIIHCYVLSKDINIHLYTYEYTL